MKAENPTVQTRKRWRHPNWAPTYRAAAGRLKISLDLVQRAANQGCLAFRNGRVNIPTLKRFIQEHVTELAPANGDAVSLRDQKLREEVRKLTLANDLKASTVVKRSAVCETLSRVLGRCRSEYERKLRDEYPAAVAGMDVPTARIYGTRVADAITAALKQCEEEWQA